MPFWVKVLGFSGLLPVLLGVGAAVLHPARDIQLIAAAITLLYGALILSFIGGAWWGLAVKAEKPENLRGWLILSVLPSLYACAAVGLAWITAGYAMAGCLLAGGFIAVLLVDRSLSLRAVAPKWWLSLRQPLSSAMALLFLTLAAKMYV